MDVHRNGAVRLPRGKRRKAGAVTVTVVDPLAWQEAIFLAGGDFARIEIVNAQTVIVHNRPHMWRHPFRRSRSVIAVTESEGEFQPTEFLGWWTTETDIYD